MTTRSQHLLVDRDEMSENMNTIVEVIDEITNDLKIREVLTENIKFVTDFAKKTGDYSSLSPTDIKVLALAYQIDKEREREDLKIRQVLTENIKFVTDFAKKTGDYSNLSPTDLKVLALAYQIDKELEEEDHLMTMMTEPTMQRTITVTESPEHTSNPEIKYDGANLNDQKLANIVDLIKKMDLRDGYDVDHFKPDKYTDDEDSDSDSDYDTDDVDPHSSDKLAERKAERHIVEIENKAVEEGS